MDLSSVLDYVGYGAIASGLISLIAIGRGIYAFRKKHRVEAGLDLFVAILGGFVARFTFRQRQDTRNQIRSLHQQILSIPEADVPRHLTREQRTALTNAAKENKDTVDVFITANGHDADAAQYGDEIWAALIAGGMRVSGTSSFGNMPLTPLTITYNTGNMAVFGPFIAALRTIFGMVPELSDTSIPIREVKIWVNAQIASTPLP